MDLSPEKLLAIARNYWRADREYDDALESPPEFKRFSLLWDETLRDELDRWRALQDSLRSELPDFNLHDGTTSSEGAFRFMAYAHSPRKPPPFRFVLVGCISILAPLYTVYGVQYDFVGRERHNPRLSFEPLPAEMRAPAEVISRSIEATFDVRRLPREVADTRIPLIVHNKAPPETTLFHAFFDSQPDNLP
ncbi:hypothetical protein [Pyxidicoccus xibeiensis]|uniref:hypothetical protein n=1 Tax=Pyxidicoccus xibeiensis TaxID=2906759 RepID=UPI0020A7DE0D|nr:hypothetical protein [Pyxidicoccus xibeiensis]MCP3144166.1 hypothetical protein [Pyxidicoccus xibeiensis]